MIQMTLPCRNNGVINAVGDYSASPTKFFIENKRHDTLAITRLLVHVEDSGTFDSGSYGNGISLTNGVKLFMEKDGETIYITPDELAIKKNPDWNILAGVDTKISSYGAGNETLNARITFTKMGEPIVLKYGDKLGVVLNDNFSGLEEQIFNFQGFRTEL